MYENCKKAQYIGPNLMRHYRPASGDYDLIGAGKRGIIMRMVDEQLAVFTEPGGLVTWYVPRKYLTTLVETK